MLSVVVTGSSSGIGYQTSKTLLASGYRVFGSVRTNEDANRVKMYLGENFIPLVFDVTDEQAVKDSVKKVSALLDNQTLTGLVNKRPIWKDKVTKNGFNNPIKKGFNPTCFIEISTLITRQKITINKKAIKNLTANKSII